MARRWNVRRALILPGAVACGLVFAGQASAATTVQATCSSFGSALSAATDGETIVLTGLCTGSGASFTLPSGVSDLTIEGAATGTNGFDGTAASGAALSDSGGEAGLTLENLTVENYSLSSPAVNLTLSPSGVLPKLENDRFLDNAASDGGGGALTISEGSSSCSYTGTLDITNSTFSGNTTTTSSTDPDHWVDAAGADLTFYCASPSTVQMKFSGDTFADNSVRTAGASVWGAGLYAVVVGTGLTSARQSDDLFKDNSIVSTVSPAASFYGGAGEWLASVDLTSTNDRFIGNSLPGPSGSSASSWGAGLYTVRQNCIPGPGGIWATATNLVATGNRIGSPSGGGTVDGSAIYAGCTPTGGSGGFHLTLINSTVSGNSAPGGVAGVDGEIDDRLTLRNTIVYGDLGAGSSELGGFGLSGGTGSITASHSDVCAVGSTASPFAGTGNLCAAPKLAGVASGNVRETASSPTIDAGSNSLVPSGVGTDFYGKRRIVGTKQLARTVDIGAAEWQVAYKLSRVKISHARAMSNGLAVTLRCIGTANQFCHGTVTATTIERLKGSRVVAISAAVRHKLIVVTGRRSYRVSAGHSVTVRPRLSRSGRALLRRFGKLPTKAVVTQLQGSRTTRTIVTHRLTIRGHRNRE